MGMNSGSSIREIVLDTETTGLSPEDGDRIVEIGCVELLDNVQTGRTYQVYINPEREMSVGAAQVTGYDYELLKDKPLFAEIVDSFLEFVGDARLVIHNAKFDINFLNSELSRLGKPLFRLEDVVDTLEMARKKYPGAPVSLDALCHRFEIDTSARGKHGALIDCVLLADVYINLLGGKQSGLMFENAEFGSDGGDAHKLKKVRIPRKFPVSQEELAAHREFIASLSDPMWNRAE